MVKREKINRREFLGYSAAGVALGSMGIGTAWAQQSKISAVMPGVIMPKPVRPIVEGSTGVKIENVPYVSPTDTLAKLTSPGGTSRYDLMVSVTNFIKDPVMGEKAGDEYAMALNMGKIPNANNLMPLFKDEVVTRAGKTYLIPVFWGYDSVIFNADKIPADESRTHSWGLLFDDKYAGRVALRDDAHQTITITALHLGINDVWNMDESDLKEVIKFLISKKKNFRTLWTNFGEALNLLSSGEVDALYGWIVMRSRLQKQGMNVKNNWPSEGLLIWNQSAFIPKDAPNAEAAHRVINAMTGAEYGKKLTEVTEYLVTSKAGAEAFTSEQQRKFGYDVRERGLKLVSLEWPKIMDKWIEAWGTFKAA